MSDYDQRVQNLHGDEDIRDVHALTSPYYPQSMATSDRASRGDFSNMSATNSTLVLAGSSIASSTVENDGASNWDYGLHPSASPTRGDSTSVVIHGGREGAASVRSVKKEEVESKITAWKNAKISEINNRFKCEDAIINGWENEQTQQSTLRMKKIERKLEEKRVRAVEKMENEIAKAHQKAQERRASAEAKRGGKIARVLEVANLMKAMGRSPVKSSFF
ncbi:remorin [Artemisia annua]|uniref:Remorin n=1 Tax=Artemisia annua TaxID=35608 RepID=A0A2U1MQ64_ARTAN|nr:remorin [Artemisia annua]